MKKFEIDTRPSITCDLKEYCIFYNKGDFIEVCEWANGDGFDVVISNKNNEQKFSITHGQLDALKKTVKYLQKET